jgi:hypothetical protein
MDVIMDVAFNNAKVFNIRDRIDVVKGQPFTLFTDIAQNVRWFTDQDPVLAVKANGPNADFTADNVGSSTVLLLGDADELLKKLTVNVVTSIEPPAVSLNTSAGIPVPKKP